MRNKAILDSGFLYATIDTKDRNHLRVTQALPAVMEQIFLPVPVLVELSYLLAARLGHSAMRQCVCAAACRQPAGAAFHPSF